MSAHQRRRGLGRADQILDSLAGRRRDNIYGSALRPDGVMRSRYDSVLGPERGSHLGLFGGPDPSAPRSWARTTPSAAPRAGAPLPAPHPPV